MNPTKVLVIRFSSIGDIVMTSPVVRCLHQQLNAEVDFLTKTRYSDLLLPNPWVRRVYGIEKTVNEVIKTLRDVRYDLVVDLHSSLRSKAIVNRLGRPFVSYLKHSTEKWLYLYFGINRYPKSHTIDRYFEPLKPFSIEDDGMGMEFYIQPEDEVPLPRSDCPRIGLVLGAKYQTKRIPRHITEYLISNYKHEICLLGGKDVDVQLQLSNHPKVRDFVGKISIASSASVLRQCDLIITGDTGLMHIAAALQKPILVLWGSTSEMFGFSPNYGYHQVAKSRSVQVEGLPCRPCSKYGRDRCPKYHMKCLNELSGPIVHDAILDMEKEFC